MTDAADLLGRVTAAMPGGEPRESQQRMVAAVTAALADRHHLLVQAGTGVGKSVGYLVPALCSGVPTMVSTSTKALQEQLIANDLPLLADSVEELTGHRPSFALLKGRGNYFCQLKGDDAEGTNQLALDAPTVADEVGALVAWAATSDTGDRASYVGTVTDRAWSTVSMSPGECPGRSRCPRGTDCFFERARDIAAESDVVVVNHHLLAAHMHNGGAVLPEVAVVVVDEAHDLVDVVSSACSDEVSAPALERLLKRVGGHLRDDADRADLAEVVAALEEELDAVRPGRLTEVPKALLTAASAVESALGRVAQRLEQVREAAANDEAATRALALGQLVFEMRTFLGDLASLDEDVVAWCDTDRGATALHVAPLDVTAMLRDELFAKSTVIATSATLAVGGDVGFLASRWGLPAEGRVATDDTQPGETAPLVWAGVDVGTPFDYDRQAMLYVAAHLPAPSGPTSADHRAAVVEELAALIPAAGGRTLALFTSTRAAHEAADALRDRVDVRLLVQGDAPASSLLRDFVDDETSCLFATTGFWQGVDVPGRSCSLVTIDRLPFPRPDDPLAQARKEAAGATGFVDVYVARAAVLLAQGVGRLIRHRDDRGVVAVLDPRLATARYGALIRASLPPMRMWTDRATVLAALERLAASYAPA